ncbi:MULTISPECIES: class I SAM-dependent methyltransferase [unclassified Streptomyces]|uniref:class I SAM-dependent methyltransferase n=1 Tax=unclassified Streptomyces TaxID=2593676 RepID=UPI000DC792B1|nr:MULTISPECIES: class I SAM-dependent methyltransferase [unclassified Streptomyces]AWZ08385.1 methyltransferase [Streptomyces sp. ICC4]AWZ16165.1 methyltransferase [Streptomyces sp. ICC1]
MSMSTVAAARWVERWECQQQRYAVDREERFTVIADVVERVTLGRPAPLVVDLGSGPGSLAARLASRLPTADVLAVDADPLLLELGRAHYGTALRYVEALIGAPGWLDALALDRPVDAAVSTTALHYLGEPSLRNVYRDLAERLRPGGVLVNGDHISPDSARIRDLALDIGRRHSERCLAFTHEDWQSWWSGAAADPEFAPFLAGRGERRHPPCEGNDLPLSGHVELLREAGFGHVGTVWQFGNSHVLVAVR